MPILYTRRQFLAFLYAGASAPPDSALPHGRQPARVFKWRQRSALSSSRAGVPCLGRHLHASAHGAAL